MNKCVIIGNLTKDPELRATNDGKAVCNFTVAVNRHVQVNGHPTADYFRVAAWESRAELCSKYLRKGNKVCCVGRIRATGYLGKDGEVYTELELALDEIEFLTPKGKAEEE